MKEVEYININYWLDQLADEIHSGRYKKIPYAEYRALTLFEGLLPIDFDSNTGEYIINEKYRYFFQDNSLGEFLWESSNFCREQIELFYMKQRILQILDTTEEVPKEKEEVVCTKKSKKETKNDIKTTIIKENDITMKTNSMFNFEFGPVKSDSIKMSIYGLAVKNASGTYVSYNDGSLIDVDILNFDGSKFLYKMPVAIKDVAAGDIVIHARKPMVVLEVCGQSLKVVDPIDGESKEILLTRSPFGFDFATKVVNILGSNMTDTANASNPFGNMWMLFALSEGSNSKDMLLPMMVMSQGSQNVNPALMYAMLNNSEVGSIENMFVMMALMGVNGQNNPFMMPAAAGSYAVPVTNPNQTVVLNSNEASN